MIVRPIPLSGTLFLILCIAILCALGIWQVKRLAWKTELIHTMETAFAQDPLKNPFSIERIKTLTQEAKPFAYGSVTGTFTAGLEFLVGPRTQKGVPGYHRLAPFTLSDGGTLLVNRGWMSSTDAMLKSSYAEDIKTVTLTGVLRRPDKPNLFTPPNSESAWYSVDPHAMAKASGMPDFPDVVFYSDTHNLEQSFPPNNHRQYAIFWFTMAFLFAAIPLAYAFWPLPKE